MTDPPWMEASLESPIPGCNRLQICVFLARFCRDLQSYPVDIVDVAMSPVQFETRHPPHISSFRGSVAALLFYSATCFDLHY
jgi:hypothetical protein